MIHDTYMISINSSTEACPGKSFLLPSYAFGVASVKALRPTPEILTTSRGIPARLFSDSSECRAKDEAPKFSSCGRVRGNEERKATPRTS
jgi:hypothetical protein